MIQSSLRRPLVDFLVSAAGPAVSALFGAACWAGMSAVGVPWLAAVLKLQALFTGMSLFLNVLPMLPSDGGRMLRAALGGLLHDHYQATRLTAAAGAAVGIALTLLAIPAWQLLGWPAAAGIAFIGQAFVRGTWRFRVHSGTRLVEEGPATGFSG